MDSRVERGVDMRLIDAVSSIINIFRVFIWFVRGLLAISHAVLALFVEPVPAEVCAPTEIPSQSDHQTRLVFPIRVPLSIVRRFA